MESPPSITRGSDELHRLLTERNFDVRRLDAAGFRAWLEHQLGQWQSDEVFLLRTRIRDLRRGLPRIGELEDDLRRFARRETTASEHARLDRIECRLRGATKAVAGLSAALASAAPERRAALAVKLDSFRALEKALAADRAELIRQSPAIAARLRTEAELARLKASIGLDMEEARLRGLLRQRGRRTTSGGEAFETVALTATASTLVPDLIARGDVATAGEVISLRAVKLGAARVELDQVLVRRPADEAEPVDVLAVVEVKRNINDLGRGFRQRQNDLAWLTGDARLTAVEPYRTHQFPTGRFDRVAVHNEGGRGYTFAPGSFGRFASEPSTGEFLERLYFVTRPGDLWGLSAAALARVRFRAATDDAWQPASDEWLTRFQAWCGNLAAPIEAPDVLARYATPASAKQIVLVGAAEASGVVKLGCAVDPR